MLCCTCFTGIPAVICGHMALNQITQSGGVQQGRGLAIAGLVLGYIGIALGVLGVIANVIAALAQQ